MCMYVYTYTCRYKPLMHWKSLLEIYSVFKYRILSCFQVYSERKSISCLSVCFCDMMALSSPPYTHTHPTHHAHPTTHHTPNEQWVYSCASVSSDAKLSTVLLCNSECVCYACFSLFWWEAYLSVSWYLFIFYFISNFLDKYLFSCEEYLWCVLAGAVRLCVYMCTYVYVCVRMCVCCWDEGLLLFLFDL